LQEKGVVIGVHIEYTYARLIEEIARSRGKSVSALLREVLIKWLEGEARSQLGLQVALDPEGGSGEDDPGLDPLVEVDVEEFEQQLGRLEEEIGQLESAVDQALRSGYGYRLAGPQLGELNSLVWRQVERWQSLRRWYWRLKRDLPQGRAYRLSARLAQLKRRLNTLLEKTRHRRWWRGCWI
jgi:hypothetical protein